MNCSNFSCFVSAIIGLYLQVSTCTAQTWNSDNTFGEGGTMFLSTAAGTYTSWLKSPSGGYYVLQISGGTNPELVEINHFGQYSNDVLPLGFLPLSISATSLTQDEDGNILAGSLEYDGFKFSKFDPFGLLLSDFNSNGTSDSFNIIDSKWYNSMGIPFSTPDGHIMSYASTYSPSVSSPHGAVFMLRWNDDGSIDTSYNGDGSFSVGFEEYQNIYHLDSHQQFLIFKPYLLQFVRIASNGEVDNTFNPTEELLSLIQNMKRIWETENGYILHTPTSQNPWRFVKCNYMGELDHSFGNGSGTIDFNNLVPTLFKLDGLMYHPIHGTILSGSCFQQDNTTLQLFAAGMDSVGNLTDTHIPNGIMFLPIQDENPAQVKLTCFIDPYGYPFLRESGANALIMHRFTYDGIPTAKTVDSCRIYPNPCNQVLSIDFPYEDVNKTLLVEVLSPSGITVNSYEYHPFGTSISTESLSPGIYIIRIRDQDVICSSKFVVE